uniref:TBC1 domain family member 23 n=1 Tax=Peronospora matthiolae TaxID=2874970 RepID=A0AAV1VAJ8_9STRA
MATSRELASGSATAALPSSHAPPTRSHDARPSESTDDSASGYHVSVKDVKPSTSERDPAQTPTMKHDALHLSRDDPERARLERQLCDEMQKRRPDPFVIRVACRSLGGVPMELRAQVWKELLGVARSERLYLDYSILQVQENLDNQRVIAADAARTRSNELRFKEPETAELVVKLLTYYCKCRSIQYKQGMNEVLAPFLLLTEQRENCTERVPLAEGVVFQCFYALIDRYLPQVFVDKEFRSLQGSLQLYRLLMLYHDPELCHYLDQHDMTPELYVTPWFMTFFARSLPPDLVFCLWDLFLLEAGPYMLHFVAYALVAANREKIFEAEFAMLPQVLSSLTFSSHHELERIYASARAILKATPHSFNRDLYSICYGGFTNAMVPFLDQIYACSSLRVYPEELVRNLRHSMKTKGRKKHTAAAKSAALAAQEVFKGAQGLLDPLLSPLSGRAPLLYVSESDDENGSTALRFVVLDCRPAEEYHKSHLIFSHHVDPSIMGQPDALDGLVKGFARMKGSHFCFVGPSIDSPSFLTRSSSKNAALNTAVRLARVISNDNVQSLTVQDPLQRRVEVGEREKVAGNTTVPSTEPVTLSCKQSPVSNSVTSASDIANNELSKVHAEHLSVTRLVQVFLQNGFKYVSGLAGGFDELERSIRSMDTHAQEQFLVSSMLPALTVEKTVVPDSTGTSPAGLSLFAKLGLIRSLTASDDESSATKPGGISSRASVDSGLIASVPGGNSSRASVDSGQIARMNKSFVSSSESGHNSVATRKKKKRATTASSSAVPTLSQRIMLLKAAAKDAVSSTPRSITRTSTSTVVKSKRIGLYDRVGARSKAAEIAGMTSDVEIQPGPIGISFRKSCTSKVYHAAVDSLVPGSQASATGLVNAGDWLVAINGDSTKGKTFLSVIKLIIEASRPVMLRFFTPVCVDKNTVGPDPRTTLPLAPTLVSATRHTLYITWDKMRAPVASAAVPLYQLQFAKPSGDGTSPWLPVVIEVGDAPAHVDANGVTDQTSGTMAGLDPGDSLVFRVRCGSNHRWGPFSPSSDSMRTMDVETASKPDSASVSVTPILADRDNQASAIFHPGVCPEVAEQGRSFCRNPLTSQASRHSDCRAKNVDIVLERGQVIRDAERLTSSGTNQIFVRLSTDGSSNNGEQDKRIDDGNGPMSSFRSGHRNANGDGDGVWSFTNTPKGGVVLQRLPGSSTKRAGPSLREPINSVAHSFVRSHVHFQSSNGRVDDRSITTSAATSSEMSSTVSSSSIVNAASSSYSPAAPLKLHVHPVSSSEVTVTWEMTNDVEVTKYQIQYVKDRLAAKWCTVNADISAETVEHSVTNLQPNTLYVFRIRSGTEDNRWGPYSEFSKSCRTLLGITSFVSSGFNIESERTSGTRQPADSGEIKRRSVERAPRRATARAGGTILDKAVAAALRLKSSPHFSSNPEVEVQIDEVPLNNMDGGDADELQNYEDNKMCEMTLPESRSVNLANWKSSLNAVHKDFRFYHVTKFEEQGGQSLRQLIRLGHRELVVTPSLLVVLDVMAATQEGFALVEEWRPLTSLAKIGERDGLDNSLVFYFENDYEVDLPEKIFDSSNLLIVVVEGAKACAEVVQAYHAKRLIGM